MSDPSYTSTNRAAPRSTSSERSTPSVDATELGIADRAPRTSGAKRDGGVLDRVKQSATTQLAQQKDRGVAALGSVTQAVRSSTQRLRDEKHETIAHYIDQAADQVDTWTRRLEEKDIDELAADVQRLARRQPAVVIGSAFALGLVAARFLKSSRRAADLAAGGGPYRSRYPGGAPITSASDRGVGKTGGEAEVAFAAPEESNPDVAAGRSLSGTRADSHTASRSTRGRKSSARTERS